jgi:hypothetical protein
MTDRVVQDVARAEAHLEALTPGARVRGVLSDRAVAVVQVQWHGTQALTLTYRGDEGRVGQEVLIARPSRVWRSRPRFAPPTRLSCARRARPDGRGGAAPPDGDGLRGLAARLSRHRQPVRGAIESMTGACFVHDRLELHGWQVEIHFLVWYGANDRMGGRSALRTTRWSKVKKFLETGVRAASRSSERSRFRWNSSASVAARCSSVSAGVRRVTRRSRRKRQAGSGPSFFTRRVADRSRLGRVRTCSDRRLPGSPWQVERLHGRS